MKNGFTLAELLGTIVILALIALIAFPAVLGLLNNSQNETDEAMQNFAITAARNYVNDNMDSYPKALEGQTKTYTNANKTFFTVVPSAFRRGSFSPKVVVRFQIHQGGRHRQRCLRHDGIPSRPEHTLSRQRERPV